MVPHSDLSDLRACFERRTAAQSEKAYHRFNEMNHYGTMTRAGEELRAYGLRAIKAGSSIFYLNSSANTTYRMLFGRYDFLTLTAVYRMINYTESRAE